MRVLGNKPVVSSELSKSGISPISYIMQGMTGIDLSHSFVPTVAQNHATDRDEIHTVQHCTIGHQCVLAALDCGAPLRSANWQ